MTTKWTKISLLGLGVMLVGSALSGCESGGGDSEAVKQPSEFYALCDDACGGGYECINGVCTLPCEVESECASTPFESTCRTRFGIGSCEAWCSDSIGASEDEGCDAFGEGFDCWSATCHAEDWVGPPQVGPPGIDVGVNNSGEWDAILEGVEFSCPVVGPGEALCELIEVYEPGGEDDAGCNLPARLDFALASDKESFASMLEPPPDGPGELCQELDCYNLRGCIIDQLTFENGGEACLTDEGDSTYFEPGYCVLEPDDPNVNQAMTVWCVESRNDEGGMGGARENYPKGPVVRVVGEGLPRPGGRLIYLCGGDLAAAD